MTFRVKFATIDSLNPDICHKLNQDFLMIKYFTIFINFFLLLTLVSKLNSFEVRAQNVVESDGLEISAKKLDRKAEILAKYLARYNSPLEYHAQDFIEAAEEYGVDWKLVPSIAGVESTFGRFIPGGYNGWGWGVYGTQAIYFNSWREGIFTVTKGLKEDYISRGLTDPYSMNRRYAVSPAWGGKVTYFMKDLERFAAEFESENIDLSQVASTPKIAAVSASPVLR